VQLTAARYVGWCPCFPYLKQSCKARLYRVTSIEFMLIEKLAYGFLWGEACRMFTLHQQSVSLFKEESTFSSNLTCSLYTPITTNLSYREGAISEVHLKGIVQLQMCSFLCIQPTYIISNMQSLKFIQQTVLYNFRDGTDIAQQSSEKEDLEAAGCVMAQVLAKSS
jgi:hypothetical protein